MPTYLDPIASVHSWVRVGEKSDKGKDSHIPRNTKHPQELKAQVCSQVPVSCPEKVYIQQGQSSLFKRNKIHILKNLRLLR